MNKMAQIYEVIDDKVTKLEVEKNQLGYVHVDDPFAKKKYYKVSNIYGHKIDLVSGDCFLAVLYDSGNIHYTHEIMFDRDHDAQRHYESYMYNHVDKLTIKKMENDYATGGKTKSEAKIC